MKQFLILIFNLLVFQTFAQQNNFCGQYEMEQRYLQSDPLMLKRQAALEKETSEYTREFYLRKDQSKVMSDTILFVIPVVFHIMHNYGVENISKAQILDAVRILNEDYQKRNADTTQVIPLFQPIIGDCQVEFRLAQLDPNGNCTDGITRHQTTLTNGGDDALKSIVQWPPDRYLNIWVENSCNGNFIAYSNYPGVAPNLDGVVIMDEYVGSIGTASNDPNVFRVLSHEIGHYLNLKHIWGDSNTPGLATNCNVDDLVFDTPNTIGSVFNCDLSQSTCTPGVIDNVQNIMDYSICDYMFTEGQCARMQAALNSAIGDRNNLWSTGNRLLTGTNDSFPTTLCAPVADFSDKKIRICEGQSITFNNVSFGGDSAVFIWQFTGGNIPSSTDTNPTVQYNTVGVFDVTLTVTNSSGSSTLLRSGVVEVNPLPATTSAPAIQNFESIAFPSGFWDYDSDSGTNWEITNLAAVSGVKSIYLQNDSANLGKEDVLYTEGFNMNNVSAPVFNFKIAFANRGASNDNLKIFMSFDCGQTWVLKYTKSGNALATTTDTSLNFVPAANQWRQDAMNILAAAGQTNVRFKFQFTSDGGNNIFIDDINIGGVTGMKDLDADAINLIILPNPAKQSAFINFELPTPEIVSYTLTDITGRILLETQQQKLSAEKQSFEIQNKFSPGLYFINLRIGDRSFVEKLIFEE